MKVRIFTFAVAIAMLAGGMTGGLAVTGVYAYAGVTEDQVKEQEEKQSENSKETVTDQNVQVQDVQVRMVSSVDELSSAMDDADMVSIEDVIEDANGNSGDSSISIEDVIGDVDEVGDRYSLKRIVLYTDEVKDSYGAVDIIGYDKYDYYIFGFATEEDTARAYEQMKKDYGEDRCMLDEIMEADDMLSDSLENRPVYYSGAGQICNMAQYAGTLTSYTAVSWGCTYMGLDRLKASISEYSVEASVDVAVIDTGVNDTNPLFADRINKTKSGNCLDGDDPADYSDSLGHGSHVAGIIADATPGNVKLTILKCFSSSGQTSGTIIQKGIMEALDQNVDVINISFCFYGENAKEETKTAIDGFIAAAKKQNTVMCVAAGNSGRNSSPMDVEGNSYPADREDVITVSALQKKDGTAAGDVSRVDSSTVEFASGYSYYGEKVDFSAPGSGVRSAWRNGGYYTNTGTSMAAPHITAAAAYVKLVEPSLTNDEVRSRLIEYSVDLGDPGKDILYGYGCPYMADYFKEHAKVKDTAEPVKPTEPEKPVKPTEQKLGKSGISGVKNVKSGISISWSAADGATGYRVYRKTSATEYVCIKTLDKQVCRYVDTKAAAGVRYKYIVKPVCVKKIGQASNGVYIYRLPDCQMTSVQALSGSKLDVRWKKSSVSSGYQIQYSRNKSFKGYKIATIVGNAKLSRTVKPAKTGQVYYVRMRTYKRIGENVYYGGWSAYRTVRTK